MPNLPPLPPWAGGLAVAGPAALLALVTRRTVGLPYFPWAAITAGFVIGAFAQPAAQRWIGRGRLDNRLGLRVALASTAFGVVAIACGSTAPLPGFALIIASVHLHWSGWRAWRVVAGWTALVTVVGEVAFGLGLLPCLLPAGQEHALSLVSLGTGTQALFNLGMTSRRREEVEQELRLAESRFRALVNESQDVVAVVDADGVVDYVSPAVGRFGGRRAEDLVGRPLAELFPPGSLEPLTAAIVRAGGGPAGTVEEVELELRSAAGECRAIEFAVTNLLDDPAVGGYVLNGTDVTARRRYNEQLVHAASHDPLTGLLNRAAFVTALQRELARVGPQTPGRLLFCDLDGFKAINDERGHDAGDAVLVHTAARLARQAGEHAVVGRFGGDEFTVLIPAGPGSADPHELRDLLAEAVAEPCPLPSGDDVAVRASFGMVTLDGRQLLADEVLREADQRMYERKRRAARVRATRTPNAP